MRQRRRPVNPVAAVVSIAAFVMAAVIAVARDPDPSAVTTETAVQYLVAAVAGFGVVVIVAVALGVFRRRRHAARAERQAEEVRAEAGDALHDSSGT